MLFLGDAANRNKYVVALADTIQPRLPAKQVYIRVYAVRIYIRVYIYTYICSTSIHTYVHTQYLDGAEFELELKQMIGNIHLCEDVGKMLVVIGSEGMLIVGVQHPDNEDIVVHFIQVQTREA